MKKLILIFGLSTLSISQAAFAGGVKYKCDYLRRETSTIQPYKIECRNNQIVVFATEPSDSIFLTVKNPGVPNRHEPEMLDGAAFGFSISGTNSEFDTDFSGITITPRMRLNDLDRFPENFHTVFGGTYHPCGPSVTSGMGSEFYSQVTASIIMGGPHGRFLMDSFGAGGPRQFGRANTKDPREKINSYLDCFRIE